LGFHNYVNLISVDYNFIQDKKKSIALANWRQNTKTMSF
jgi:hypothetical protein